MWPKTVTLDSGALRQSCDVGKMDFAFSEVPVKFNCGIEDSI
jgi:hypothetical protein